MTNEVVNKHKKSKNDTVSMFVDGENDPLLLHRHVDYGSVERSGEAFNGASLSGAVSNLSTTIIGAGIMALPATMKVLGLGLGILVIAVVAILTELSVEMLLRFSKAAESTSYGDVMKDAFGKVGRTLLQVCVIINNIGVLVVYMIILGDVLSGTISGGIHHAGVLEKWFGEHWWNGRVFVLLAITLGVFSPLACLKRIDSLKFTSALAVAMAFVFLVITVGITIFKLINGSIVMPRLLPAVTDISSVWKLFTVVPVLVTSYVCHFNVHSIENELDDSSRMQAVVKTSLAFCSTIYVAISIFGFLLFGDSILDDVLANFDTNLGVPSSSQLNDAVPVSYALHIMLVFPIIFYPLRLNLDGLLFPSAGPLAANKLRFSLFTCGLIAIVFLGANFIPSIWDAFQFTGATAAVCLGFIFPAAIALRDAHGIATKKDKVSSVFMIGLAVFANFVAIYSDASALFHSYSSPRR